MTNAMNGDKLMIQSGLLEDLKHSIQQCRINPKTWQETDSKSSLLHFAAASNQVDIIDYLAVECKVDVNSQDSAGNTPLHLAVINGHIEASRAILGHGADCSICNIDERTALHLAMDKTSQQSKELIMEFLKFPHVDLFARGKFNSTCLHSIAKASNIEALEAIHSVVLGRIKEGGESGFWVSKLLLQDKNGLTAFHVAARVGTHEFLEYLLSKSADYNISSKELLARISSDGWSLLHYAVEGGHIESVRILLKYGGDPTAVCDYHPPPLHLACSNGKLSILKVMVDMCGKEVLQMCDQHGGTALHSSTFSIHCSKDMISYLEENGVSVNTLDSNGFSALSNAIQLGSVSATEQLLMLGADPLLQDQSGYNCLHRAVMSERMEVFKKLIGSKDAQAMAVSADNQGNLPIHVALKLGLSEMVIALLDVTSEEFTDSEENNYIHLAAISGEMKTLTHLLTRPYAQRMINESNSTGFTPMHYAALGHSITTVKMLTDYGAVIHKNNDGCTPFMLACSTGNLEAAEVLYNSGKFQRDWMDHSGNTALHLAVKGGNPKVIAFCLDEGMPITLNYDRLSFFDTILAGGNTKLAAAAISHSRWEGCIDVCCPNKPHPILRIIDQIPDVYGILLDKSFTRCDLDPTHRDYWEEYNFKCLNLQLREEGVASSPHLHMNSDKNGLRIKERKFQGRHKSFPLSKKSSMTVLQKLLKIRQESYLLHPVVKSFIKLRWEGFGIYFMLGFMLVHFLLALFFSIFIMSVRSSLQSLNTSIPLSNLSDLEPEFVSLSIGSKALFVITFMIGIFNLLAFILQFYIHGFNLFKRITWSLQVWFNLLASLCIITFLSSILARGLSDAFWDAAALGMFFSWLCVGSTLLLVNAFDIGVYVIMLKSTTIHVLKVLAIFFVFILGLSLSLFILVGSEDSLQYTNQALSIFTSFSSLIGNTDYNGFASLDSLRFSTVVFLFLLADLILVPIVITNLLIGLAVGDIAAIQKEAVISQITVEVVALTCLDKKVVPHCINKHFAKEYQRVYPNRNRVRSWLTKIFHQTQDGAPADIVKSSEEKLQDDRLDKFQQKLEALAFDQLEQFKRLESMLASLVESKEQASH